MWKFFGIDCPYQVYTRIVTVSDLSSIYYNQIPCGLPDRLCTKLVCFWEASSTIWNTLKLLFGYSNDACCIGRSNCVQSFIFYLLLKGLNLLCQRHKCFVMLFKISFLIYKLIDSFILCVHFTYNENKCCFLI